MSVRDRICVEYSFYIGDGIPNSSEAEPVFSLERETYYAAARLIEANAASLLGSANFTPGNREIAAQFDSSVNPCVFEAYYELECSRPVFVFGFYSYEKFSPTVIGELRYLCAECLSIVAGELSVEFVRAIEYGGTHENSQKVS